MKKADGIIVAAVLLVAVILLVMTWGRGNGQIVVLYDDETEIGRYPLMYERTIRVELEDGYNTVVISDGTVSVSEADCANQVCVHTPAASRVGDTVVCLPHRFYIVIK
ncbi:MAG: NusG domain II-containing protein [Lachnospiraceae bacterium]|nr:NusG domain II-containing protein [Lachnospiraceae bacterium]